MKGPYSAEKFVTLVFVVILILLLNPFGFFMPDMLTKIILAGTVVLFALYVYFILKESPQDEREQLHRFMANRSAYLFGSAILVLGIVYQGSMGHLDPWLLLVLGTMVIAKILSLIHSEKNH